MNKVAIIASLAAGLALQQVANAGTVVHSPITIYHAGGLYTIAATGSFHQALLSSDSVEFIGCRVSSTTGYSEIVCEARNAAGQLASCYLDSPSQTLLQIAGAISEYSFIEFAANSSGQCIIMSVDNSTYNK